MEELRFVLLLKKGKKSKRTEKVCISTCYCRRRPTGSINQEAIHNLSMEFKTGRPAAINEEAIELNRYLDYISNKIDQIQLLSMVVQSPDELRHYCKPSRPFLLKQPRCRRK